MDPGWRIASTPLYRFASTQRSYRSLHRLATQRPPTGTRHSRYSNQRAAPPTTAQASCWIGNTGGTNRGELQILRPKRENKREKKGNILAGCRFEPRQGFLLLCAFQPVTARQIVDERLANASRLCLLERGKHSRVAAVASRWSGRRYAVCRPWSFSCLSAAAQNRVPLPRLPAALWHRGFATSPVSAVSAVSAAMLGLRPAKKFFCRPRPSRAPLSGRAPDAPYFPYITNTLSKLCIFPFFSARLLPFARILSPRVTCA